ncbi:LysE family translocator [Zavarzinia compransoris]|uniref:LysE family translocator n=1 Tax=Zavarzinia marina TaxID=2911065 RepID=UPI001F32660A|nr:LysE family translocator [Zavarzinia marina]MCF4164588.1 LysE family translocator [Zavarzinia marina]
MDFDHWIAFVAASTVLLFIPGPTVLLVLGYALAQGRRVAVATVAGVALGDLVAMSASLAGLGTLVLASAELFTLLKWLGAAYLVWLGIKLFRSPLPDVEAAGEGEVTARGVFGHAAVVTALNPKSIVFFIAFVPQFVDPAAALGPQFVIMTATFVGLAAGNALVYALLADQMRHRLLNPAARRWMPRLGGGALIAMGVATAAFRRGD